MQMKVIAVERINDEILCVRLSGKGAGGYTNSLVIWITRVELERYQLDSEHVMALWREDAGKLQQRLDQEISQIEQAVDKVTKCPCTCGSDHVDVSCPRHGTAATYPEAKEAVDRWLAREGEGRTINDAIEVIGERWPKP